jgi:predicted RNA polymerase sigma factor
VHRALYPLFSEGYHGASEDVVRGALCREAMRLAVLLVDHAPAAISATYALAASMYLGAARLPARTDAVGDLTALPEQDRSRWEARLIADGLALLERSASGNEVSPYHLEAAIAGLHPSAPERRGDAVAGDRRAIRRLLLIRPSPVVALNRAMALAHVEGPARGLEAVAAIDGGDRLRGYPFYEAALGELELRCGRLEDARRHFEAAHALARNDPEQRFLTRRITACSN